MTTKSCARHGRSEIEVIGAGRPRQTGLVMDHLTLLTTSGLRGRRLGRRAAGAATAAIESVGCDPSVAVTVDRPGKGGGARDGGHYGASSTVDLQRPYQGVRRGFVISSPPNA